MEYTASAVIMAVASAEGLLNELLSGARDERLQSTRWVPMANVSKDALKKWSEMWESDPRDSLVDKCHTMLEHAGLTPLPRGQGPLQNLEILISLRNELTHSKPVYRAHGISVPRTERDPLERSLLGKFKSSQLLSDKLPFMWQRCLSAGCAQWAVSTEIEFRNALFTILGIPIMAEAPEFE